MFRSASLMADIVQQSTSLNHFAIRFNYHRYAIAEVSDAESMPVIMSRWFAVEEPVNLRFEFGNPRDARRHVRKHWVNYTKNIYKIKCLISLGIRWEADESVSVSCVDKR